MTAKFENSELLEELAKGNKQFSADVFKQLLKLSAGNLLVCPLSAEITLTLVHAGARGKTAEQLSKALYLPKRLETIKEIFKELDTYLHDNECYTVSSANKIYLKDGYKIKDQFKNTATETFFAEIQNIDFGSKHQAASEINKWVEEKTHGNITNIVNPSELHDKICAVLINAMYFLGKWTNPFKKSLTETKSFYRSNEDQIRVEMMKQTRHFDYWEDSNLNAKFLEMAYEGNHFTMTIVLPNDIDGLTALEARINEVFQPPEYCNEKVHVEIPKFKIETTIKFIPILQSLGVVNAFQDDGDFSAILVNQPMKISQIIQKAFIEVDEKGTKAAAATVVDHITTRCIRRRLPKQFIADHPFIFYLKIKDVIVFVGRCVSPIYEFCI